MTISTTPEIIYPESDGKPLADNTIQFHYITTIQGGIDGWFKDNPDVFVAGDLFWYPVEGEPWIRQAPDVMVILGRPKGDRRSYKQWEEENIAPQVIFEIASKSNTQAELEGAKLQFYQRYGVEEYYLYDPERGRLKGWVRLGNYLSAIESMQGWISPKLKIRFELVGKELQIYRPDGERFATFIEILEQKQKAKIAQQQAELARDQEAKARRNAIPELLKMVLNIEQIAKALSLSLEEVQSSCK